MKFFKFLSLVFPLYIILSLILPFGLLKISLVMFTLPFTPILKGLGMYVTAYWSLPTTLGIILSAVIWEIVFLGVFFLIRKPKKV